MGRCTYYNIKLLRENTCVKNLARIDASKLNPALIAQEKRRLLQGFNKKHWIEWYEGYLFGLYQWSGETFEALRQLMVEQGSLDENGIISRNAFDSTLSRRKEELRAGRRLDTKRFIKSRSFKVLNIIFLVYSAIILYIFLQEAQARNKLESIIQKSPIGKLCDFCKHATPAIASNVYVPADRPQFFSQKDGLTAYVCQRHYVPQSTKASAISVGEWGNDPYDRFDKLRTDVWGWSIFCFFMYLFAVLLTRGAYETRPGKGGDKDLSLMGTGLLLLIAIPAAIILLSDLAEILNYLD
jgi:hypothetical protein